MRVPAYLSVSRHRLSTFDIRSREGCTRLAGGSLAPLEVHCLERDVAEARFPTTDPMQARLKTYTKGYGRAEDTAPLPKTYSQAP